MLNGQRIREAREKGRLTQTTIDYALGLPLGTCNRLEDNRGTIDPSKLQMLCDVLKVDRVWLLGGDIVKKETSDLKERVSEYLKPELVKYMRRTGKTYKEVSEEIGINPKAFCSVYNGHGTPSTKLVDRIKSVTGIDLYTLLKEGEHFSNCGRFLGSKNKGSEERSEQNERVGNYLKEELYKYVDRTGKSMEQIAATAGISCGSLYRLIRGQSNCSVQTANRIKSELGIDLNCALKEGERFSFARNIGSYVGRHSCKEEKDVAETAIAETEAAPADTDGLRMQLLRMNAEMLKLKARLGEDVLGEYEKLVDTLLGEIR